MDCDIILYLTLWLYFELFWKPSVLFVGPLIPCFRLLVMSALGFKNRVDPFTCILCCLCAPNSSHSPLLRHLLTSWCPAWQSSRFDPRTCTHSPTWWDLRILDLCQHYIIHCFYDVCGFSKTGCETISRQHRKKWRSNSICAIDDHLWYETNIETICFRLLELIYICTYGGFSNCNNVWCVSFLIFYYSSQCPSMNAYAITVWG